MKLLILLVAAVIHMTCATLDDTAAYNYTGCGTTSARRRRAVGSQDSDHKEYPWMAFYGGGAGCGGTIVTDTCIITAKHCISETKMSGYTVLGGLYDKTYINRDWNVQERKAAETIFHPTTDFAIIRVSEPFDFSKDAVNAACLPTPGSTYADVDGTATGWGRLEEGGTEFATILQEVTYPIKADTDSACILPGKKVKVYPWELCAAHPTKGTCHADSGGPMVVKGADGKWSVVGVNSYSMTPGGCINPDYFMRVTYFLEFIQKNCPGSGPILGNTEDTEPAAAEDTCEDSGQFSHYCADWKSWGYCGYPVTHQNCQKTCFDCDPTKIIM